MRRSSLSFCFAGWRIWSSQQSADPQQGGDLESKNTSRRRDRARSSRGGGRRRRGVEGGCAGSAADSGGAGWAVPGQLLVRFRDGTSAASQAQANSAVNANVLQSFTIVPNLQLVSVPDGVGVQSAIDMYRLNPAVLYAQPNFIYHADVTDNTPNDPRYPEMWNLNNTGQGGGKVDADIDAPQAWNKVTGSREVVVGDLTTGVDYTHPDLKAHL